MNRKTIEIYTDGACRGNPGPGGWGALLLYCALEKELFGGEALTTNNRMELIAVIAGLEALGKVFKEIESAPDYPSLAQAQLPEYTSATSNGSYSPASLEIE